MKDFTIYLDNSNVKAFLSLIRYTEGANYNTLFGGDVFYDYKDHPRIKITKSLGGRPITSTAAGAYQFLSRTWDGCAKALSLPDFTPQSQDLAALYLVDRRGALNSVLTGNFKDAIYGCNKEWASLPGSPYGQPTKTLPVCLAYIDSVLKGGVGSTQQTFPETKSTGETNMAPFLAAAIPILMEAAPDLIRVFGKGEQSEKNAVAAEKVAAIAKQVTGEFTIEAATQTIQSNPEYTNKFKDAIQSEWYELVEAGGGGIAAARVANDAYLKPDAKDFWKAPAFWVSNTLMSMVFMLLVDVFYVHPERYDGNLQVQVVTALLLIIGMVSSYWLGTSASSQRKTELMNK
jgi:muramidase (phage lysozyme)